METDCMCKGAEDVGWKQSQRGHALFPGEEAVTQVEANVQHLGMTFDSHVQLSLFTHMATIRSRYQEPSFVEPDCLSCYQPRGVVETPSISILRMIHHVEYSTNDIS